MLAGHPPFDGPTALNVAVQHLKWLTLMTADEVASIAAEQEARPEARSAQRALAFDLTARVHGRDEAERQVTVASATFSDAKSPASS